MRRTRPLPSAFGILVFLFIFGLFVSVMPDPARATSFYERPFPETVQDAPIVVRGKVGSKSTDWSLGADGTKRIYTFYDLALDEVMKGTIAASTIRMREMGGEKDGLGMQVAGSSQFDTGEDVVVFLGEKNPDESYDVRGMMMGKLEVHKGEDGKEYLTGPAINDLKTGQIGDEHTAAGGQGDTPKWTVESLRTLIRSQGRPGDNPPPQPKAQPSPPLDSKAHVQVMPSTAASLAAPALQPSTPEEPAAPPPSFPGHTAISLAVLGGLALIGGILTVLRRSRKKPK